MTKLKNVKTSLDTTTGELVTIEQTYSVKVKPQDKFYMIFFEYATPVKGLTNREKSVLSEFCERAAYDTGIIDLPTNKRAEICESCGIHSSTLSTVITKLKEKDLITGSGGVYTINPQVFWKGSLDTRNKLLKDGKMSVTINFNENDKE